MAGVNDGKRSIEDDEHAWFQHAAYKFRRLNNTYYDNAFEVPEPIPDPALQPMIEDIMPRDQVHEFMNKNPTRATSTPPKSYRFHLQG